MPELVTVHRQFRSRGFEVVTCAKRIDSVGKKDTALKVLRENHASGTNYLYNADGKKINGGQQRTSAAWTKQGQSSVHHSGLRLGGKVIYRHGGEIDPMELKKAIVDYLGRTYADTDPQRS